MDQPLIIGFIADLMFAVRVEQAASQQGFRIRWVERAAEIAQEENIQQEMQPASSPRRQLAEHLVGPGARLVDMLTREHPALLIFDLGNAEIPWREWIPLLKSVPATRRIPLVCFGSHVDEASLQTAQSSGADAVLARSKFSASMPDLIRRYARVPDYKGMQTACRQPLSALAVRGLEEFNRGEYFEAHETLEEAWNADESPAKELYRAILQVAVAYLQIERGNFRGAVKMFLRLRQWIDPLPSNCRGVDVAQLRLDADAVHAALTSLGAQDISSFDRTQFKPVIYRLEAQPGANAEGEGL